MKWLLLMTIFAGGFDHSSSTAVVSFDSKEACEAAGKAHEQAIRQLHWQAVAVVWTCNASGSS